MPIIPPLPSNIFDSVNTILNSARTRLNDRLSTLIPFSGKILGTEDAFTQAVTNNAWRRLQEDLANLGYTPLKQEIIIKDIPATENLDPASQQFITWDAFFDGDNFQSTPTLPPDFVHPLKVWERWTNQNQQFPDAPMECWLDGMPTPAKSTYNGMWEWRNNAIYIPGSTMSMDFRILYVRYMPDFINVGTTRWFQQPVPLVRAMEPLACYISQEFCNARTPSNDAEAAAQAGAAKDFETRGQGAMKLMFNRDVKMKQRVTVSRQPRSGRSGGARGYWGGGYD